MGFGGDLMIAAAAREYRAHTGRRLALVFRPGLTDLLCGRLRDATRAAGRSPVLFGNHDLVVPLARARRSRFGAAVNRLAERVVERLGLRGAVDRGLVRAGARRARGRRCRLFYVDSDEFSYAAEVLPKRMIWKAQPNAVAGILSGFPPAERPVLRHPQPPARFHGLDSERERMHSLLREHGLTPGSFVVMEPGTNADWFGSLRAWPLLRWQALVDRLRTARPDLPVVRIGVGDEHLAGVIDLSGRTSFREAAALIGFSALFVGTEGGLMHAAAATDSRAVIIWGGVTRPDFAGYPDRHVLLFNELECSHCGMRQRCPWDAACIRGIGVAAVYQALCAALMDYRPGIRALCGAAPAAPRASAEVAAP